MISKVDQYLDQAAKEPVSQERQHALQGLIDYACTQLTQKKVPHLHFICTHNSRRSQFSQVWAQVVAHRHGVPVMCYSGGVEVTACHPHTVQTLERAGLVIVQRGQDNPTYLVQYAADVSPVILYSKTYDAALQPQSQFAAIMTCAHADEHCPYIVGADCRLPIRYKDPKVSDATAEQESVYDACSLLIASEMQYVFGRVAAHIANTKLVST